MLALIGMVVVVVMVFGGYMLAGGKLAIVLRSLPFEMMIIGGAAAGTFLIANGTEIVKGEPWAISAASSTARNGSRRTTGTCSRSCT